MLVLGEWNWFLHFTLVCLLLVNSNTIDFYILILYPVILLNLFISSNSFFVCKFLRTSYTQVHVIYMKTTLMSIDREMDKEDVVYIYSRILVSH